MLSVEWLIKTQIYHEIRKFKGSRKELTNIDGGSPLDIFRTVAGLAMSWYNHCSNTDCPGNYDNHEDVRGMGFPICA